MAAHTSAHVLAYQRGGDVNCLCRQRQMLSGDMPQSRRGPRRARTQDERVSFCIKFAHNVNELGDGIE